MRSSLVLFCSLVVISICNININGFTLNLRKLQAPDQGGPDQGGPDEGGPEDGGPDQGPEGEQGPEQQDRQNQQNQGPEQQDNKQYNQKDQDKQQKNNKNWQNQQSSSSSSSSYGNQYSNQIQQSIQYYPTYAPAAAAATAQQQYTTFSNQADPYETDIHVGIVVGCSIGVAGVIIGMVVAAFRFNLVSTSAIVGAAAPSSKRGQVEDSPDQEVDFTAHSRVALTDVRFQDSSVGMDVSTRDLASHASRHGLAEPSKGSSSGKSGSSNVYYPKTKREKTTIDL